MSVSDFAILIAIFSFGGLTKGLLGIGLPSLLIAMLTFFYEPRMAVSLILFAIMTTNIRQAFVGGPVLPIIWRYRYFAAIVCIGTFVIAVLGANVPVASLMLCVGVAMILFAISSLFSVIPKIPKKYDTAAQIVGGSAGAVLGGLTAIWGPPLAMYLMGLRLKKNDFVQALGVMFGLQSIPLVLGFFATGDLNSQTGLIGLLVLLPTFVGMYFGEKLRDKVDTKLFYKLFLCAFLLLGLNLIRKGWLGL